MYVGVRSGMHEFLPRLFTAVFAMAFTADTFESAGFYEGEIEITKADGNIQTVNDLIKFNARDDFD